MSSPLERPQIPLEILRLEPMASGEQSLRLSSQVTWEAFPSYAHAVVAALGGMVEDRADSAPERMWTVKIQSERFWISFDDLALGVSLDPQNADASRLIPALRETLLLLRDEERAG